MLHKKRLIAIGVLIIAGLGWFLWKHNQRPDATYVFDFEARIEGETVAFHSAVGCYPFEAGIGTLFETVTHHAIRAHAFAAKLKSRRTFFVSVPDICAYALRPDGSFLSAWRGWDYPAITPPRAIVPLTYLTDEYDKPDTVRLFTGLAGKSSISEFEILRSTVRQFDPILDRDLPERPGDSSDPFGPSMGSSTQWAGVAFLPVLEAPQLEAAWIAGRWSAGACEIIRLNGQGREAIAALDSYASSIGPLWPQLWQGIALSDLFVIPRPDQYDATSAREGFDSAIPVHLARGQLAIEPEQAGTIDLFRFDASDRDSLFRPAAYVFNGIQLYNDNGKQKLPFVIRCAGKDGLYVPTVLHFSRPQR
jgi:hypothetical protein